MTIPLLLLLIALVVLRYGPKLRGRWWVSDRPLIPALVVGGIGFAIGFVGPMILDPTSGNGPLLGIFITGPIGFVVGWIWGLWREWQRHRAATRPRPDLPS